MGEASSSSVGLPLAGITVLALEHMMAAPFATQVLADLGATVVKVEPLGGESARHSHPQVEGDGGPYGYTFLRSSVGKKSVAVDLKSKEGRDLILKLVPEFDVVVDNFRAGALDRLGLGWDTLVAAKPDLIQLSISGFGAPGTSPYTEWAAYALVGDAVSGHLDLDEADLVDRLRVGNSLTADAVTGLWGAIGVLTALYHRRVTGHGRRLDLAMVDALLSMSQAPLAQSVGAPGSVAAGVSSQGVWHSFAADDGPFVVAVVRTNMFERLATYLGCEEWLEDPSLADPRNWRGAMDLVIRPAIEIWAKGKSKHMAAVLLADAGIAAAPCLTLDEVIDDPHYVQREAIEEVAGPGAEMFHRAADPVWREPTSRGVSSVPAVGEHTSEVLSTMLGLPAEEIARLHASGVIATNQR